MADLTHYKKLRDPNYFGAYELITGVDASGKIESVEATLTIVKAVREKGKTKSEAEELVVYFAEAKPMIVNAINSKNITKATGSPFVEHWGGKKITLYVEKVKAFGEFIEAIRVRPTPPVVVLPQLTPTSKAWAAARTAVLADPSKLETSVKKRYSLTPENEALLLTPETTENDEDSNTAD